MISISSAAREKIPGMTHQVQSMHNVYSGMVHSSRQRATGHDPTSKLRKCNAWLSSERTLANRQSMYSSSSVLPACSHGI